MVPQSTYSMCRIGDQLLWKDGATGDWYAQGYYQLAEIASCFSGRMERFTAFGRIAQPESSVAPDFRIPREAVPQFNVAGVSIGRRSVVSLLLGIPRLAMVLKDCEMRHDINWFMLPSISGLVGLLVSPPVGIRVAQMVGSWDSLKSLGSGVAQGVPLLERLTRAALRRANLVVFVSNDLRQRFGTGLTVPTLVVNESRLRAWMITEMDRNRVHHPLRILYAGRLSPEKGLDVLITAFAAIIKEIPCELWIAGKGPLEERLRNRTQQLGLSPSIRWFGWVPWGERLFEIMRDADLLVLPSLTEGLPLVLIDAMSQSLPVVASACGGIPEIVQNEKNGLLFPPGDVDQLVDSICRIAYDPALRTSMVRNGLVAARQNTVEETTGRVVHEIYSLAESTGAKGMTFR